MKRKNPKIGQAARHQAEKGKIRELVSEHPNNHLLSCKDWLYRYTIGQVNGHEVDVLALLQTTLTGGHLSLRINEAAFLIEVLLHLLFERAFLLRKELVHIQEKLMTATQSNRKLQLARTPKTGQDIATSELTSDRLDKAGYLDDLLYAQSIKAIQLNDLHNAEQLDSAEHPFDDPTYSIESSILLEYNAGGEFEPVLIVEDVSSNENYYCDTTNIVNESTLQSANFSNGYHLRRRRSFDWSLDTDTFHFERHRAMSRSNGSMVCFTVPFAVLCDEPVLTSQPIQRLWLPPTGLMTNLGINGSLRLLLQQLHISNWCREDRENQLSSTISPSPTSLDPIPSCFDFSAIDNKFDDLTGNPSGPPHKRRRISNSAKENGSSSSHEMPYIDILDDLPKFFNKKANESTLFSQIVLGKSKEEAAKMFVQILVSKSRGITHLYQDRPFADITISHNPVIKQNN